MRDDVATPRVLLVEDDESLREALSWHLEKLRWPVRSVADGVAALDECARTAPDLIVLDVMLPEIDGIALCRLIRERFSPSIGVLVLTARDDESTVVTCLEAGADDFVTKPCRPSELIARLRALSRRVMRTGSVDAPVVQRGSLRVDTRSHTVTVASVEIALTTTEYLLLVTLAREPGRVFSRAELLELVWHTTHQGYARNVDCHIARLRKKFERQKVEPPPIAAVYGAGYRYEQ